VLWGGIMLGAIGVIVILLPMIRGFWMRMRMSMQRRKAVKTARRDLFLRSRLADVARGGREGEDAEPDVLSRRLDELKQDFIDGTARLTRTGAEARNRPWFMLVGAPGSGRSTLMEHSDLDLLDTDELSASSKSTRLRWWFHSNGTILDPAGEVLRPEWGNRGAAEYRELLKWIRKDRSTPELRGIILAIEAKVLLDSEAALQVEINHLRGMLLDTVNVLGLDLPVYVLITKCDEVEGLSSVMRSLSGGGQSRQIVGWSTDVQSGEPFDRHELATGMAALAQRMGYVGESLLARSDLRLGSSAPDYFLRASRLYSLPDRVKVLGQGITELCNAVFGEVASLHNCSLRGVYLTASEASDAVPNSRQLPTGQPGERTGRFIRDVFVEKIFRESTLARVSPTRFRKIYLTIVTSMAAVYLVLLLFIFGTFGGTEAVTTQAQLINSEWAPFEAAIREGTVRNSPLIDRSADGTFVLLEGSAMRNSTQSRGAFLTNAANAAFAPMPVPSAYRLTSLKLGTLSDNLMHAQRMRAYRSLFNPMVLAPLVHATQDSMRQVEVPWTAGATTAFGNLLQIEQAMVNLNQDWYYTFRFGAMNAGPMLAYVFERNAEYSQLSPRLQALEIGAGISTLLPQTDVLSLSAALNAAGAGTAEGNMALVYGLERYTEAWSSPMYLATLPLGMAEQSVSAIQDYQAAMTELETLATTLQTFTMRSPSEGEANAALARWNAARTRAVTANEQWLKYSGDLKRTPSELLGPLVARATKQGAKAVAEQFEMLLARTKVLGAISGTRGALLLQTIEQRLTTLQATVTSDQANIASNLLSRARVMDKTVWVSPKPVEPATGTAAKAAAVVAPKAPPALLATLQDNVLSQIDIRMTAKPTGLVVDFSATLAAQVIGSRNLDAVVADALSKMGTSANAKSFAKAAPLLTAMANWNAMYWAIANTIDSLPQSSQQIASSVASTVSGSSSWFRPGIPLTRQPDSGTFDAAYNPVAAAAVVAPWQSVKSQIDSVKSASELVGVAAAASSAGADGKGTAKVPVFPMTGQAQLNSRYKDRAVALSGYVKLYVNYWARMVQASGQFQPMASWSDFRNALATLRPFQVNSALQGYLQQVHLALEVGFITANPTDSAEGQKLVTSLKTQLTQLTPITTSSAEASILRWEALPQEASSARATLLGLTVKQFSSRYFFLYTPGSAQGLPYWNQLIMAGLESLSNSITDGAEQAIAKVAGSAYQWPVLNTGNHVQALTQAQVDILARNIGSFYTGLKTSSDGSTAKQDASGNTTPKPASQTLLSGGTTGDAGVDYELARLRDGLLPSQGLAQGNVPAMPPATTPSQKVGNVVMALASIPAPVAATFIQPSVERTLMVPLMPTAQKFPVNGASQYRYVEVWVDGTRVGARVETMRGDGQQLVRKDINIAASATSLQVKFFRGVDDVQPGPVVEWSGTWALIDAYLNPQTDADIKTGVVWIPILFDNDYELECYWWLGLKLDRPLPLVADWPSATNWPDNLLYDNVNNPNTPAQVADPTPTTAAVPNTTGQSSGQPTTMTSPTVGSAAAAAASMPAQATGGTPTTPAATTTPQAAPAGKAAASGAPAATPSPATEAVKAAVSSGS
jgi:hypothetical protein